MKRFAMALMLIVLTNISAQAHFIWIVPAGPGATKAKVVFSDDLDPDEGVPIDKIATTKLLHRDTAGKETPLAWKKLDHAFEITIPATGPATIGGVCRYGVFQRGDNKPFLLNYYPKYIQGDAPTAKAWGKLPFEILVLGAGKYQVVFAGKPVPDAEVVVVATSEVKATLKADKEGEFKIDCTKPGTYGMRAKHVEAKAGEQDGKKCEESRHYATLVFRVEAAAKGKTAPASVPAYPAMPQAVSSFGAAIEEGWVYIYGGHCAKTHEYSTDAVIGTFHRVKVSDPGVWEELPGGPGLQGLAVVSHQGKIYRIGGMQPRNKPGDKADNHSVATFARFDPAIKKWESLPDLPEARSSHDAVVLGNQIIVVGGWSLNGAGKKTVWASTALVMDLSRQPLQWQVVKQPFQRRALTAAIHDGKVYAIAGIGPDAGIEPTINIYDPAKDRWATGLDLPGPRRNGFSPAAIAAGGRLYVNGSDGKVYGLALKGDEWADVGQVKQARIVHRMIATNDNQLLILGGAAKGDNVAASEVILLKSPQR